MKPYPITTVLSIYLSTIIDAECGITRLNHDSLCNKDMICFRYKGKNYLIRIEDFE